MLMFVRQATRDRFDVCSDVDRSIMEHGDLIPCDDITCQGRTTAQGQEVTRACDVTRSTCVCSRGFVLQGGRCVGSSTLLLLFYLLPILSSFSLHYSLEGTRSVEREPPRRMNALATVPSRRNP